MLGYSATTDRFAPCRLLAVLGVVLLLVRPAVAEPSSKLVAGDEIRAQFQAGKERVAVIVTLVPPARAHQRTDWNNPASVAGLRAANHARAAAVLQALPARQHKLRHRFDNFAGFSCDISQEALDQLARHPWVAAIEPVRTLELQLNQGLPLMNALATRGTYNGTNLAIAICDTGIDYTHPRLGGGGFPNSKVIGGYDFGNNDANPMAVGQAHGTACAGIAAGDLGTVGDYIGGVAPGAKLYALKISPDNSGSATSDAMIAAWDWCVTHQNDHPDFPIMVISTSFGGGRYFSACDGASPAMTAAANNAVAAGITVLAAAGNDGYCDSMAWPACISSVISVGAVYDANFGTHTPCVNSASCANKIPTGGCSTGYYVNDSTAADKVTAYSNTANFLDLFGPANQCYTLDIVGASGYSSGDYATAFGGTSAACPYAAGAVAALQHAAKTLTGNYLTPAQVRSNLITTGNLLTDSKIPITKPRVNLGNAIAALGAPLLQAHSLTLTAEDCTPPNAAADPGETVTAALAIRNSGGGPASNVVATLLATNGVIAPSGPQSYGNIAGGGTIVTQTFTFTVTGACGAIVSPVLQIHTNSVLYGHLTYELPLGAVSPIVTTNNHSSGALNLAINDNSTVEVPLTVTTTGVVADVNVKVRLNHTYDGDLTLSLVHPDGTVVALAVERGGSGDNFGSGATNCSGTFTIFDDAASIAISNGTAPFAGAYRPDNLLSALNGKPAQGTWKLRVTDSYSQDTGTLYCFQLDLAYQARVCCSTLPDLALAITNTPQPVPLGAPVTYALTVTNLAGVAAPNVTVTNQLPATVTFLSASSGCVTGPGAVVVCHLGTLDGGAGTNLVLHALPQQTGPLLLTGIVATTATELGLLNNLAIATNTVLGPTFTFTNPAAINIPATGNSGPASVYPSTLTVTGLATNVTKVTVTLHGLSHGRADNLDVLLVGPTGLKTLLMSDAGGNNNLANVTLTFDMAGPPLPTSAISSGTYAPTDYSGGDTFDPPAPAGPYTADLTVFHHHNPNGTWSLYIMDDAPANTGSLGNGWSLSITTDSHAPPTLTGQPQSQTVCAGNTANFLVTATGFNPGYQWQKDGVNLADGAPYSGTSSNLLTISPVGASDAGNYRCIVTNSGGSVTSAVATLTVVWPALVVEPPIQNLGHIPTGLVVQTSFTVSNAGCGTLSGTLDVGGVFSVTGQSATQMPVTAQTNTEGPFTNWVVFTSNGGVSTNALAGIGAVAPAAAFVASVTNGTAPLSVVFTDLSSGTITQRLWHFGDVTSNVVATTVTRDFTGTNDVFLVVSGPLGVSTSTVVTVTATNVIPTADLVITASVSAATVTLGDPVTLVLTVSNLGASAASTVTVTGALPPNVTLVSASPECLTNQAGILCQWAGLPVDAGTNATLTLLPLAPGGYINLASVSADQPDPNPANNVASVTWTVPVDADADGMPDEWELAMGLDPHDPADAGQDTDGDGFTNLQEWWIGSHPAQAPSHLRITGVERDGDDLRIFWQTAGGRTNVVEASGAATNAFEAISPWLFISGNGPVLTNYLDAGGGTNAPLRLYRIRLVP